MSLYMTNVDGLYSVGNVLLEKWHMEMNTILTIQIDILMRKL